MTWLSTGCILGLACSHAGTDLLATQRAVSHPAPTLPLGFGPWPPPAKCKEDDHQAAHCHGRPAQPHLGWHGVLRQGLQLSLLPARCLQPSC